MTTPDTEWADAVEDIVRRIETLETDYSDGSYVSTSDAKKIGNDIHNLLSSRDTYWKERVREEKLGWEGYVVVDPQSNNYKCSPIFSSVKEAEKWRRDFGESALKVATVDVILKN